VVSEREAVEGHRERPALVSHQEEAILPWKGDTVERRADIQVVQERAMLGNVIELSVVVRDLEAAIERYTTLFGLKVHGRGESKEFGLDGTH